MASLLMKKKLTSVIYFLPPHHNLNLTIFIPSLHFSTQTQEKEDLPFIAQYLISSFGFSKDRAIRIGSNSNLMAIKSADRPESVIRFLEDIGLTDIQVKNTISLQPQILSKNVSKILKPFVDEVIAAGFTKEALIQLIQYNSTAVSCRNTLSRLKFWKKFVDSEEAFLKFIRRPMLISMDIDKRIVPRINVLREYGLSNHQIAMVVVKADCVLRRTPDFMKVLLERIENLGFSRGSKMFMIAIEVLSDLNKDTIDRKEAFFKTTYGWSDEDVNLALKKFPRILRISQKKVESAMEFLITKVGLHPRSITLWPTLLGFSLQRRLIPRHYVLSSLKSKGLKSKSCFQTAVIMPEKRFIEKCILPYKEELPYLEEEYAAACAGKLPLP